MLPMIMVRLWKGTEVLVLSLVSIPSRYLTDTFQGCAFFSHLAKIISNNPWSLLPNSQSFQACLLKIFLDSPS